MRRFFRSEYNSLSSNIVIERFINVLEKFNDIHKYDGTNIDGSIVSTGFHIDKKYSPRNIFNSLEVIGSKDITFLDCYPIKKSEFDSIPKRMWNLVAFGGQSESDIFIPALVVADNTGSPYLLYNVNIYDFSTDVTEPIDPNNHGFKVVPINSASYNDMRKSINVSDLYRLYSKINKYTILDLPQMRNSDKGYKFKEYFERILENMRFNEKILEISHKFIYTPVINLENTMNEVSVTLDMKIDKAVVVEGYGDKLTLKQYEEGDSILVIYDLPSYSDKPSYSIVRHKLPIIDHNGCVYECSVELGNDIVPTGESYKIVKKVTSRKGLNYEDTIGNIPLFDGATKIPTSFYEGYDYIKKDLDNSISSNTKMAKSTDLINYTIDRLFTKGESFVPVDYVKVPSIINTLKIAVKEYYSPESVTSTIKESLRNVMNDVYESGDYRKIAICKNIYDSIK